uniref:Uncharacterized protein n=1 Tax=Clytia hemisphaerica TaxID=252671 RepID=A0A7M5WUR9_9CNID
DLPHNRGNAFKFNEKTTRSTRLKQVEKYNDACVAIGFSTEDRFQVFSMAIDVEVCYYLSKVLFLRTHKTEASLEMIVIPLQSEEYQNNPPSQWLLGEDYELDFRENTLNIPRVNKSVDEISNNLTVSFWYKHNMTLAQDDYNAFTLTLYPLNVEKSCHDFGLYFDDDNDTWVRFGGYVSYPRTPVHETGKWNHFLLTWDRHHGKYSLYLNGEVKYSKQNPEYQSRGHKTGIILNLGNDVDKSSSDEMVCIPDNISQGTSGNFYGFNIWQKLLTNKEIKLVFNKHWKFHEDITLIDWTDFRKVKSYPVDILPLHSHLNDRAPVLDTTIAINDDNPINIETSTILTNPLFGVDLHFSIWFRLQEKSLSEEESLGRQTFFCVVDSHIESSEYSCGWLNICVNQTSGELHIVAMELWAVLLPDSLTNTWMNLQVKYSAKRKEITIYLNGGQEMKSTNIESDLSKQSEDKLKFQFGNAVTDYHQKDCSLRNDTRWFGQIAEAYLWTRELSNEEMNLVFGQQVTRVSSDGLIFAWYGVPNDFLITGGINYHNFDAEGFQFPK